MPDNAEPQVSVLMPTYKVDERIGRSLSSLLNQSFRDFEIVIVNDGDDYYIRQIVAAFDDSRLLLITNENRLGLAESLNLGLKKARGRYLARADADDYYPEYRLQKQYDFMEGHPEISVCGSWQQHVDPQGLPLFLHKPPLSHDLIQAALLFNCELCHSTLFFRKKDFMDNELWYDPDYAMEDFELWTRAVKKVKFATIPESLGYYEVHQGSRCQRSGAYAMDKNQEAVIIKQLNELGLTLEQKWGQILTGRDYQPDTVEGDQKPLRALDQLLQAIWRNNLRRGFYQKDALRQVLQLRWLRACPPASNPHFYLTSDFALPLTAWPAASKSKFLFYKTTSLAKRILQPVIFPLLAVASDQIARRVRHLVEEEIRDAAEGKMAGRETTSSPNYEEPPPRP